MDPDPDPRKEIEVDPDLERGLKLIRIRPNAVDPGGSGSDTLVKIVDFFLQWCFFSTFDGKCKRSFLML